MTSYNIYPDLKKPMAPLEPQSYQVSIIQSKQERLLKLCERYVKKYSKYTKILGRLVWLNACSSSLTMPIRILSVPTLSTVISLPVSTPLGAVSLARVSVSGVAMALTSKYQRKLTKVTKLVDIVTSAIAVFECCIMFSGVKLSMGSFVLLFIETSISKTH